MVVNMVIDDLAKGIARAAAAEVVCCAEISRCGAAHLLLAIGFPLRRRHHWTHGFGCGVGIRFHSSSLSGPLRLSAADSDWCLSDVPQSVVVRVAQVLRTRPVGPEGVQAGWSSFRLWRADTAWMVWSMR